MKNIIGFVKEHKKIIAVCLTVIAVLCTVFIIEGRVDNAVHRSNITEAEHTAKPHTEETAEPSLLPAQTPQLSASPSQAPEETEKAVTQNYSNIANESGEADAAENALEYSIANGMELDPETGMDRYNTEPIPEGMPMPVEPQNIEVGDVVLTCTLSVSCATILDNMDLLNSEKAELIPQDGYILPPTEISFNEGESVFNVLQRTMKQNKIHMEFVNTPMYNSAYIEAINNLYELDCGRNSGWMYKVNGWFPSYGCSRYELKQGDVIEWVYTCDRGRDVGGDIRQYQ